MTPTVSMIVCTYNRTPLLWASLSHMVANPWMTRPLEIIVVDDGSDDGCEDACRRLTDCGLPIRYVYNHRPYFATPCQPRNAAARMAEGTDLLMVEPEVRWVTDVIGRLAHAREQYPEDILYGWTYHANNEGSGIDDAERMGTFPYYTLYRKSWLLEVQGYDEGFENPWGHDDFDLNGRLAKIGHDYRRIDECEAFHAWHPSRIEPCVENEARCKAKVYPRDIVANRELGEQWGVVIPRP